MITFPRKPEEGWWHERLAFDGDPYFHVGYNCSTCCFPFEKVGYFPSKGKWFHLPDRINAGLRAIDDEIIAALSHLLPGGDYIAALLEVAPVSVKLGSSKDYFANETKIAWERDDPGALDHYPKIEYYRTEVVPMAEGESLFEFVIPLFGAPKLETVCAHAEKLTRGVRPTAVAIGVLDAKAPAIRDVDHGIGAHWCLAHYLLDGHHKMYAAAILAKPITMLSLISLTVSGIRTESVDALVDSLGGPEKG